VGGVDPRRCTLHYAGPLWALGLPGVGTATATLAVRAVQLAALVGGLSRARVTSLLSRAVQFDNDGLAQQGWGVPASKLWLMAVHYCNHLAASSTTCVLLLWSAVSQPVRSRDVARLRYSTMPLTAVQPGFL
jgi:hypothetical protein